MLTKLLLKIMIQNMASHSKTIGRPTSWVKMIQDIYSWFAIWVCYTNLPCKNACWASVDCNSWHFETHTVCTCLQHENAKLLASETDYDYKVLKFFTLNFLRNNLNQESKRIFRFFEWVTCSNSIILKSPLLPNDHTLLYFLSQCTLVLNILLLSLISFKGF